MALGYCQECRKLVSIKPAAQKWGSRATEWRPIPHDAPDGAPCIAGPKRDIR